MRRSKTASTKVDGPESAGVVTINDVASAAGVSIRTASRVLNVSPNVNAKTRARVQKVIRELNYVPNLRARALASKRSFMFGLVHDDPNAEIADQMQRGIFGECSKHGYELLVHPCDYKSAAVVDNVMSFVRRSQVDGLIVIAPVSENVQLAKALAANGTPVVGVASAALDHFTLMIVSREREASALIAEHFVELGHKAIGFISGPRALRAAGERQRGFTAALQDHGIKMQSEHVCEGDWSFESGLACARKILRTRSPPTAIYASNDRMAAGVLKIASEAGIRVPQDLSVVGFDDSYFAQVLTPALTTINRPIAKIGERAAQWLLSERAASVSAPGETLLKFFDLKLTKRESTAPPPAKRRR
jgi:LacI family transcriptional regulator